jgi:Putative quorum-sensing-regulated virulence factor
MKDSDEMPFGKHKGEKLGDVPASYLLWLADQPDVKRKYPELYAYIDEGRVHLEKETRERR